MYRVYPGLDSLGQNVYKGILPTRVCLQGYTLQKLFSKCLRSIGSCITISTYQVSANCFGLELRQPVDFI